jgi:hypothetical protein
MLSIVVPRKIVVFEIIRRSLLTFQRILVNLEWSFLFGFSSSRTNQSSGTATSDWKRFSKPRQQLCCVLCGCQAEQIEQIPPLRNNNHDAHKRCNQLQIDIINFHENSKKLRFLLVVGFWGNFDVLLFNYATDNWLQFC